jgi:hypothetical protein
VGGFHVADLTPGTKGRYDVGSTVTVISLEFPTDHRQNEYINAGVMSSLPADAVVEIQGPSNLGTGMVEVVWRCQRYAVFQPDLVTRATLARTKAVSK